MLRRTNEPPAGLEEGDNFEYYMKYRRTIRGPARQKQREKLRRSLAGIFRRDIQPKLKGLPMRVIAEATLLVLA